MGRVARHPKVREDSEFLLPATGQTQSFVLHVLVEGMKRYYILVLDHEKWQRPSHDFSGGFRNAPWKRSSLRVWHSASCLPFSSRGNRPLRLERFRASQWERPKIDQARRAQTVGENLRGSPASADAGQIPLPTNQVTEFPSPRIIGLARTVAKYKRSIRKWHLAFQLHHTSVVMDSHRSHHPVKVKVKSGCRTCK
jgi:hypothetical protein